MSVNETPILQRMIEVLRVYPLCDRCLGRLYARKGLGLNNKLRGCAIKTLLTMYAKDLANFLNKDTIINIARNIMFEPFIETIIKLGILDEEEVKQLNMSNVKCYVCGGNLDEIINHYYNVISSEIRKYDVRKFHVGVKIPNDILKREEELIRRYKFEYAESIKNEIKREIGKMITTMLNLEVDFEDPHIVILVDLEKDRVSFELKPLLIKGRYLKIGRNIAQSKWITRLGKPRTDISIAGVLETLCSIVQAEELKIHAAGREDLDVRMLGTGRPLIVELKHARKRLIPLRTLEDHVNKQSEFIQFKLDSETTRKDVTKLKIEAKYQKKIYRALFASFQPLTKDDVRLLEEKMRNTKIKQRTPLRVLHRRKDIVRVKMVYRVKCNPITENLIESLIECQGGLYVKELIEGDEGRTNPSFSSIISKKLKCIELDVLAVY